jgi:hypothetical protein
VIITGRPASGLTGVRASGLAGHPASGLRFVAIGILRRCSSRCGTHAYQIDGTREYHDRQEEG